ncbi:TerC family protein [Candidatus Purcelliella pentastirinorum]|uniref:TerC family protein n=1 Tax=Candidatus Purcelliella pentastirinorum TaxID=472834 RepID=UPI002368C2AF|nr:TerC family protein [Candidatus Purcelliella pentastirinorum]WDI78812.1 TerC family protein [Candidatus Purcelliella pentastirinorum]WDR79945.1 TerC family protein [Candidatus Purcelliella pentastirinorum]
MVYWIFDSNALTDLGTLTILEIILSFDNIIFLSLLISKLPKNQQGSARLLGLIGGLFLRILFLISIIWIINFTNSIFFLINHHFSIYDLFLFFGGFFLLWKSLMEIYEFINSKNLKNKICFPSFGNTVLQILFLDIIFSLDSVIVAIGISNYLSIIIISIIFSVFIIFIFVDTISRFINSNSSIKMLSLVFVLFISISLILESFCFYISKKYIYFSMFFSIIVEILNILRYKRSINKINN